MLATFDYVLFRLTIRLNFLLITYWILTESETIEHLLAVCLHDNRAVIKISLLLLRLLSQNVTVISVLTLDLACSSKRETLLCSGLSFNFWHFFMYLIINNVWQRIYQGVTHFFFCSFFEEV